MTRFQTLIVAAAMLGSASFAIATLAQDDSTTPAAAKVDLRPQLIGAWALAGSPDSTNAPEPDARIKFFGLNQWSITQSDPASGELIFHHGGSFTLNGNDYTETIKYAAESTKPLIGNVPKFKIAVDGDTLIQRGVNNDFNERWVRIKP